VANPSACKKSVEECLHCGFKQMENYAAARVRSARPWRPLFYSVRTETGPELADDRREGGLLRGDFLHLFFSIFSRQLEIFWEAAKPGRRCRGFECKRKTNQVSGASTSTNLPSCSFRNIDLRDYKNHQRFSRKAFAPAVNGASLQGDLASSREWSGSTGFD